MNEFFRQLARVSYIASSSIIAVILVRWSTTESYSDYAKISLFIVVINSLRELGLQSKFYFSYSKGDFENAKTVIFFTVFFFLMSLLLYFTVSILLGFDLILIFFLSYMILIPICQFLVNILNDYFERHLLNVVFNVYLSVVTAVSFMFSVEQNASYVIKTYVEYCFLLSSPFCLYVAVAFFRIHPIQFKRYFSKQLVTDFSILKGYSSSNTYYSIYQRFVPFVIVYFLNDTQAVLFSIMVRVANLLNEPVSIYFSGRGAKFLFKDFRDLKILKEIRMLYLIYFFSLIVFFFCFFDYLLVFLNADVGSGLLYISGLMLLMTFFRAVNSFISYYLIARSKIESLASIRLWIAVFSLILSFCFYFDDIKSYSLQCLLIIEFAIAGLCTYSALKGVNR